MAPLTFNASSPPLKVAVVSDLHAFDPTNFTKDGSHPSSLDISVAESDLTKHPIEALLKFIADESLAADILLCPGDLGDKSQPVAAAYAWKAVHKIADSLGARLTIGTAGNHDVDSRFVYTDHDARGQLQSLTPLFPIADEKLADRYWSRHFISLVHGDLRVVALNSSAYHGTANNPSTPEYEHGRVSNRTLSALTAQLTTEGHVPLNILVCHHHPQPLEEWELGASDIMQNGAELIRQLDTGGFGDWLIIHGHKHYPKLSYSAGTSATSPVVMAAGSLCAKLQSPLDGKARNQFYILTFDHNAILHFGLVGRFAAWDWSFGVGWQAAQKNSGLPRDGGFGFRENPRIVRNEILGKCGLERVVKWDALCSQIPRLPYQLPEDLRRTLDAIERSGSHRVIYGAEDRILHVERR